MDGSFEGSQSSGRPTICYCRSVMQVNPGIFKAYDSRGIYPSDLNETAAYAIGQAFVTFLKVDKVLVGRDMRTSGPQLFDAVTRGIMDQGADVVNIGMVS